MSRTDSQARNGLRRVGLAAALAAALLAGCGGEVGIHERSATPDEARFLRRMKSLDETARSSPDDPGPLTEIARMFLDRGNFEMADANLQKALALRSDFEPALVLLGRLKLGEGEIDGALDLLARAVALAPKSRAARRGYGLALFEAGRLEQAEEELRAAVELTGRKDVPCLLDLGAVLFERNDLAGAAAAARDALAVEPSNAKALYDLGLVHLRQGRPAEALACAEKAAASGEIADVLCLAGAACDALGDAAGAEARFRRAAAAEPAAPLPWRMLADMKGRLGLEPGRLEALERFVELDLSDPAAIAELAAHYRATGAKDRLAATLARLIMASPRDAAVRTELAGLYLAGGRPDDAARQYRRAIEIDPASEEATRGLAAILASQGAHAEAKPLWEKLLALKPDDPAANAGLARALLREKSYDAALERLLAAERLAPSDASIKVDIGTIYAASRRSLDAERCWLAAAELDPRNAAARWNLAMLYASGARTEEALRAMRGYIELRPDDAGARRSAAVLLRSAGRTEEAAEDLAKLVELAPDDVDARMDLARAESLLGRHDEAITQCREVLLRSAARPEAMMLLAGELDAAGRYAVAILTYRSHLRYRKGDVDAESGVEKILRDPEKLKAAIGQMRELRKRRPKDLELAEELAGLLGRSGDRAGELAVIDELVELAGSAGDSLLRAAKLCRAMGRPDDALARLGRLLKLSPGHVDAMAEAGEIYLEQGKSGPAARSFEKAVGLHPEFFRARMGLGRAKEYEGAFDDAIEQYRLAARLEPDNLEPARRMERIYREALGDIERADRLAAAMKKHSPPEE